MSPNPSNPEAIAGLIRRATAADEQPPFSDQCLVELGRGDRDLVEVDGGAAVVGRDEFELVVDPDARCRGVGTTLVEAVLERNPAAVFAWAHGDHPASRTLAARFGFEPVRTLLQLRAPVVVSGGDEAAGNPVSFPEEVAEGGRLEGGTSITAFRPGTDDTAWLNLNARAFADHPEQGGLTQHDLDSRKAEPWFNPDDFLLLWDGRDLVGFCWLKIGFDTPAATQPTEQETAEHDTPAATQPTKQETEGHPPRVGEFYAVGIDPDRQGEGLGRALMDAGMARLAEQGIRTANLYVEADNAPALALYQRYGFTRHTIDVRYRRLG